MIYLHDYITQEIAYQFCEALSAIPLDEPVQFSINTYGGDMAGAWSIIAELKKRKNVTCFIDGIAYSAGTMITSACSNVVARSWSVFGIHNPTGFSSTDDLTPFKDSIIKIYMGKCNLSKDQLSEMMNDDDCMDIKLAKKYGFIDEINDSVMESESEDIRLWVYNMLENTQITNKSELIYNKFKQIKMTNELEEKDLVTDIVETETENKIENELEVTETPETETEPENVLEPLVDEEKERMSKDLILLNEKVAELHSELLIYKEKELVEKDNEIKNIINLAVTENKIEASAKDKWFNSFKADFKTANDMLSSIKSAGKTILNVKTLVSGKSVVNNKEKLTEIFSTMTSKSFEGREDELLELYNAASKENIIIPAKFTQG